MDYLRATLRGRLHNEGNNITIYPDDSTGIKDHPLIYNSDFKLIEDIADAKYHHEPPEKISAQKKAS